MKKKLLLIALPALMALSGCANVSVKPAEQKEPAIELMAEDNLAHEEIFGAAEESAQLKKTNVYKLDALTSDFVKVGYQIKFAANGEGTADDTISIRFVAAIKNENVYAYWSRGLAQPNGDIGAEPDPVGHAGTWSFKLDDGTTHQSNVIYNRLTSDGDPITAGSGEYVGYTGFVIYTLRNIPYESYKDSYLAAYVSIIDKSNGENNIKSQAIAVKIERNAGGTASKNAFSFDSTQTMHFLQGRIGGTENTLLPATEDTGSFYAHYSNVAFDADDYFGSFYYSPSAFQFCGYASYFGESADYFDASDELGGYVSPKAAGTKSLYVYSSSTGEENKVYTLASAGATQTFKLKSLPDWLTNDGGVLFASIHLAGGSTWNWISISNYNKTTGTASFSAPNNISGFLLVRCKPGTTTPNWDAWNDDDGRIWNKTEPDNETTSGLFVYNSNSWVDYHKS